MKRFSGSIMAFTLAGALTGGAAAGGPAQAADEGPRSSPRPQPVPSNIKPLPRRERTPLPPMGGHTPLPGARPPAEGAPADPPRETGRRDAHAEGDNNAHRQDDHDGRDETSRGGHDHADRGYYRNGLPGYYDGPVYDRYPRYDDGYRRNDPPPLVAADDNIVTDRPADRARANPLLPPDDLLGDDDDASPALRKLLDGSPQYREATAQLLRAWADYARAAEKVLGRLRPHPRYQNALSALADAEEKVAEVRDRPGMPAVNLVTAAQQAMLARRAVRKMEQAAIDADPVARRAKLKVDDAVERRNAIRNDLAARLPARAVGPNAGE